jgi:hypothetical protein
VHRSRKHRTNGKAKTPAARKATVSAAPAKPKATPRLAVTDDRHVLVITSEQPEAIVLSTKADADRVADLLDVLGVRSRVLPLEA